MDAEEEVVHEVGRKRGSGVCGGAGKGDRANEVCVGAGKGQ